MTESGDETIRLGDRYELGGLLGRGGMADVRVGRDLRLGRTVAVKLLRTDLSSDDTFQARFRREAQSSAALNHPSIVAVYDTGDSVNTHGAHVPYIVMEYVEGQTLRDIMRGAENGRKILPERALSITGDVLSALDYSHRSGIIHRDIKPANVMMTPSGQVKVMDFGIARAIADTSSAMTQTAAVIGTAQYLSPEQARGETVDARSDIYSTGCLLYELLTGRPPFVGESPVSVAYQHVREEAKPPSDLNPDVSPSIDAVVAKSLAKRVEDRYQSAGDMRRDIERVLAGQAVDAPTAATAAIGATAITPAVGAAAAATRPTAGQRKAVAEDEEEAGRRWWLAAVVGLLLVVAAIVAVLLVTNGNDEPEVTTVDVPAVAGREEQVATRLLTEANFEVATEEQADADIAEGRVIESDPPEGTAAEPGSTVTLVVSTGPEEVAIPDVQGFSFDAAQDRLEELGLTVEKQTVDDEAERDQVINTNPSPGESVQVGSTVTIIVSRGQTTVPNVINQSQEDAEQALQDAGLEIGDVQQDAEAEQEAGIVSGQSLASGQRVPRGTAISITVSDRPEEPEPTETPTPETPPTPDEEGGD
ncbi:Stk1 family PASTA domain-containing Ser/Thr kinase [Aeromicrobium sp. CF3.5]|uniref:Stk1 family PASTA domain-containing Ser/Thr kinase n=1 Tax=Aeromicrobium sp. CF3.5 TaxID=3373078 RepID=UPI003EE4765D